MYGFSRHFCFLYMRFKTAIGIADDALNMLSELYEDPVAVLGFGNEEMTWLDGMAVCFLTSKSVTDLSNALAPALKLVDAWAMGDDRGDWIENPSNGPFSRFFDGNEAPAAGRFPATQAFILFHERDDDEDATSDNIRSAFGDRILPVVYFEDGRIFFIKTGEPESTVLRRMERLSGNRPYISVLPRDLNSALGFRALGKDWRETTFSETRYDSEEAGD